MRREASRLNIVALEVTDLVERCDVRLLDAGPDVRYFVQNFTQAINERLRAQFGRNPSKAVSTRTFPQFAVSVKANALHRHLAKIIGCEVVGTVFPPKLLCDYRGHNHGYTMRGGLVSFERNACRVASRYYKNSRAIVQWT